MRNLYFKICACALSVLLAVSATACDMMKKDDASSQQTSSQAQEVSSSESDTEEEEPDTDIGEHKDYTKEVAEEAFMSGGVLIVKQDGHYRAMDLFAGSAADLYVINLNDIKDRVDSDVKMYSMVVPTSNEFYCPSDYQENVTSQRDLIQSIGESLINIENIDTWETLNNHNAEPIYSRTDHHWQGLGAYYACKVFAKRAGVEYADLSTYEKVDIEGYVGSMPVFAYDDGVAALESDPETFTYYKPSNKYATTYYDYSMEFIANGDLLELNEMEPYYTYMKGDSYCARIKTDVKNGRKLLIVKDSYGNAVAPFLTGSFEEILVVDMRYLEVNLISLIDEMDITDVLFVMNTFSAVGANAENLETLCNNPNVGEIKDVSSIEESEPTDESSDIQDVLSSDSTSSDGTYGSDGAYNDGTLDNGGVFGTESTVLDGTSDVTDGTGEDYGYTDDTYANDEYYY